MPKVSTWRADKGLPKISYWPAFTLALGMSILSSNSAFAQTSAVIEAPGTGLPSALRTTPEIPEVTTWAWATGKVRPNTAVIKTVMRVWIRFVDIGVWCPELDFEQT